MEVVLKPTRQETPNKIPLNYKAHLNHRYLYLKFYCSKLIKNKNVTDTYILAYTFNIKYYGKKHTTNTQIRIYIPYIIHLIYI